MKVELLSLTQTALIIPKSTGIIYTNQVGGTECDYPEVEGYLVPIEYDVLLENRNCSLTLKLRKLFPEGSSGSIDWSIAEQIQKILSASPFTCFVEIDWNLLNQSKESWLYVRVCGLFDSAIGSLEKIDAVLTWPNAN